MSLRLDRLAKGLAGATSRREVLKYLAGALFLGSAGCHPPSVCDQLCSDCQGGTGTYCLAVCETCPMADQLCGSCNTLMCCPQGAMCCPTSYGGTWRTGCCTNTMTDAKNCGGCAYGGNGFDCTMGGALPTSVCCSGYCCTGTGCVLSIDSPILAELVSIFDNVMCCSGTCRNISIDPNYCGSCNNVCPSGYFCFGGQCLPVPANSPMASIVSPQTPSSSYTPPTTSTTTPQTTTTTQATATAQASASAQATATTPTSTSGSSSTGGSTSTGNPFTSGS